MKAIATLILLLTAMILVGIIVFNTSSQFLAREEGNITETVKTAQMNPGWLTYSNEEYEFSLSYPPDWRLVDNPDKDMGGTTQLFSYPSSKYIGGGQFQDGDHKIEISYLDNPDNLPLEEFAIQKSEEGEHPDGAHFHDLITLGNAEAVKCTVSDEIYEEYYLELTNGTMLNISVYPNSDENVRKILSTFRN